MKPEAAYKELVEKTKEVSLLDSCGSVLVWDQQTYMPPAGAAHRADQLGLIASLSHEKWVAPRIGELLETLEASGMAADGSIEAANIREIRRDYDKVVKLPKELVVEFTKTTSLAQEAWARARKDSDFKSFLPWLEKVFALLKRKTEVLGWEGEAYDALLDEYEPGCTTAEVEKIFSSLRAEMTALLGRIQGAPRRPDVSIVERAYDVEVQRLFGESVAAAMGFDFDNGRLDKTTHPFCDGVGPGDTRILTRYNPNRLNDALFGTMHEAGHGLYEMGLDKAAHFGTPLGQAASLGLHESQSRMWENQVGRSKAFWSYFLPVAKRLFRDSLKGVSLEDFYGAVNDVRPSYIRVEADEATYNLHILLRFELERALLKGDLKPADIPGAWNEKFEKFFGLKVDKDSNGCLQDVHWSAGLVGYFPTYTLGNMHSAQFFEAARKDLPDMDDQFARGQFGPLREWLRENIHKHGRRYPAGELCKRVTGKPLGEKPLVDYLNAKYQEIYGARH